MTKYKRGDILFDDEHGIISIFECPSKNYPSNHYTASVGFVLNGEIFYSTDLSYSYSELATESEKQKLFDALKKDGKQWNAKKFITEDIPILVPDWIGVYKNNERKYLLFNEVQLLGVSPNCYKKTHYNVSSYYDLPKIQCKLVYCDWEDLEIGDIAYKSSNSLTDKTQFNLGFLNDCVIKLKDDQFVKICNDVDVVIYNFNSYSYYYKLVEINE